MPPLDGWGEDPDKIEAVIRDDPEALALWREAMTNEPHKHIADSNNVTITVRGNTRAYTLDRLNREAPELYRRVVKKELSANEAAIKAARRQAPAGAASVHGL